jgi:hypothetical protein
MSTSPTPITFTRQGNYAFFTDNYDLLVINDAILASGSKPWLNIETGSGDNIHINLVSRGMAFYDTVFAKGRPAATFIVVSPGTYVMSHPTRPVIASIVPYLVVCLAQGPMALAQVPSVTPPPVTTEQAPAPVPPDTITFSRQATVAWMKSTTPADWKEEKPSSSMRMAQFKLPAAEGDKDGAELAVFKMTASGSVDQNLERQRAKFLPAQGKDKIDEKDFDPDPFVQFGLWFGVASSTGVADANAMTLSTATSQGMPSASRTQNLSAFA